MDRVARFRQLNGLALYTFVVSVVLMLLATGLLLGPGLLSSSVTSIEALGRRGSWPRRLRAVVN